MEPFGQLRVGHLLDCSAKPASAATAGYAKMPGTVYSQSALPSLVLASSASAGTPASQPGGGGAPSRWSAVEVRPGASVDPLALQLRQLARDVTFIEAARREGSRVLVFDDAGGATWAAGVVIAYLMHSQGVALLSAFLHVRERLQCVEPPVALVHLLGAWRVHLLDNEASTAAQEEPRFASLSGPLATPRQLSARTSTSHQ